MVVETSLTIVLDEPPLPPDPELPPADCADEVDEVADVEDVADVDDADDFDEDDVIAFEGVDITAAAEEAIALIDIKTSPEGSCGRGVACLPCFALSLNAAAMRSRRSELRKCVLH